jgi:hypothetical protein
LDREGRLRGDTVHPDYDMADPRADAWYACLNDLLHPWVFGRDSLLSHLRWSQFECDVIGRFYPQTAGLPEHRSRIDFLAHWYNEILCRVIEDTAPSFRSEARMADPYALRSIQQAAERQRQWIEERLAYQRSTFFAATTLPVEWDSEPAGRVQAGR